MIGSASDYRVWQMSSAAPSSEKTFGAGPIDAVLAALRGFDIKVNADNMGGCSSWSTYRSLRRLMDLCAPPAGPIREETSSSHGLPADYRALLRHYGGGSFDDFLWVLDPASENPNLNLWRVTHRLRAWIWDDAELTAVVAETGTAADVGGDGVDVVQWAATDNGDMLFWLTVGPADSWPTVILPARSPGHLLVREPAVFVLCRLLSGELPNDIFPEDFPSATPGFAPQPRR